MGLLLINAHLRAEAFAMSAHYYGRVFGTEIICVGDSITAGGRNWGFGSIRGIRWR